MHPRVHHAPHCRGRQIQLWCRVASIKVVQITSHCEEAAVKRLDEENPLGQSGKFVRTQ